MIHEHPLKILKHAKSSIWLLIFPILRGIRSFSLDFDAFYTWITGGWFDLLVLIVILAFGYFRWLFTWMRLGKNHIRVMSGIFVKRVTEMPYKSISVITAQHSFYLRPFHAVRVHVDTDAGVFGTTDLSMLLHRDELKKIQRKLPKIVRKEKKTFTLSSKWYKIIFFSFVFSSSLSGAVYVSALIFNAGRIVMEAMRDDWSEMYRIANDVSENMSEGVPVDIPPIAIILMFIVLGTWLLSFIINIFRYSDFVMKKDTHIMRIISGAFTRRIFNIIPEKINYLDLRQSFITKLFRVSSLNISCSGYGKGKNELPVLLPLLTQREANDALDMLGFKKYLVRRKVRPVKSSVISYISIPLTAAAVIFAAGRLTVYFLPQLSNIMFFVVLILEIPFIWLTIVKLYAHATTGVTVEDDFCCIRYSRFFAYHTILADKNKLVKIQIFQSLINKKTGTCRLDFYFNSEKTRAHKVKELRVEDAQKIIEQLGVLESGEKMLGF